MIALKTPLVIASVLAAAIGPAVAAPWVRGFVVDNYEPAFYYGGRGGTEAPGSDCPKGTIPILDYKKVLKTSWRTDAEVEKLTLPVSAGGEGEKVISPAMQHRGFRRDIDSYINPFTAPDAGMRQVTGRIAEGFDLDGKASTGGFTSPSGERGIDNAFYRAWGCIMSYRGTPYHAYLSQRANDKMLDGLYTMVIRLSGNQDSMNDDSVTLEIGYSPDHVVKDPMGNVIRDVSFRAIKTEQYSKLKARIRNGVLESEQTDIHLPAFSWGETNRGDALFQKGRIRLTLSRDGGLSGLVGGYRDWREVYGRDTFNVPSGGATRETYYHENQIAMYYALKRNADGIPDPKTGRNTAISAAYRFTAKPAFVVDPPTALAVDQPPYPGGDKAMTERQRFLHAIATRVIEPEVRRAQPEAQTASSETTKPQNQGANY
ncbi:MAG TPA: hypothetical protein VFI23_12630 [Rhizomicrobium sp.]|nr:hypothetical protein [Rhizomicrobium sp.]